MSSLIVVHYGEIGTKGANRPVFEKFLEHGVRRSLRGLESPRVFKLDQRLFVNLDERDASEAMKRLSEVFGVVWYARVEKASLSYPEILETCLSVLGARQRGDSFRVSARRSDKSFPMGSQDLAKKLGEDIIDALGLTVDLHNPGVTVYVDVLRDRALVYTERVRGLAGLPVGVSGRVLHLLSGGIDSPVAAWLMMKRGCRPTYLHFYLAPTSQAVLQSKMVDLIRTLERFGGDSDLVLIPFAPYQLATTDLPSEFEPVVFRRFMRMVAERLAQRLGCSAISTGDNLAQVASQTLQNIVCIDSGSSVPTLRPLLGYDKDEIVRLSRLVGTYEVSLKEYKDCCAIISRHPRTRMKVQYVDEASAGFGFEELAEKCISMGDMVTMADGRVSVKPLSELLEKAGAGIEQHVTSSSRLR
ncbi:MAG: tRNA 4-thiouridine(8) synthase ThiI [Nitrososphaerota archaeon]|nr:tRNA 4-thiouridine(8) synthase ThiI [Nitrososphaerota archaeon]